MRLDDMPEIVVTIPQSPKEALETCNAGMEEMTYGALDCQDAAIMVGTAAVSEGASLVLDAAALATKSRAIGYAIKGTKGVLEEAHSIHMKMEIAEAGDRMIEYSAEHGEQSDDALNAVSKQIDDMVKERNTCVPHDIVSSANAAMQQYFEAKPAESPDFKFNDKAKVVDAVADKPSHDGHHIGLGA